MGWKSTPLRLRHVRSPIVTVEHRMAQPVWQRRSFSPGFCEASPLTFDFACIHAQRLKLELTDSHSSSYNAASTTACLTPARASHSWLEYAGSKPPEE